MATLTVTTRGEVTFPKEISQHLGMQPGGKLEVDLLPDGRATLSVARPPGNIDEFIGLLTGKTNVVAPLEQIEEAIARGSVRKRYGLASSRLSR